MEAITDFIARLPKVELHVHLVGSATEETVLALARRHPDSPVPRTAEGLREFYEFRDFPHFIDVYGAVNDLITEQEDLADLVRGVASEIAAQQVRYTEIEVYPHSFVKNGIPRAAVTEALDVGARDALTEHGVRIGYIFDFPGQSADSSARHVLSHALDDPPEALLGFGIGGIEAGRAAHTAVIRDVFEAAFAAGLHCVPHAGETTGPESVWEAIDHLHAERIGHGIRSLDDPRLIAYLRERQLPVDVAPTSNVRTRCVAALGEHPLPRMLAEGLNVTLNSDDPPMFGTTLSNEYLMGATVLGLSRSQLAELTANAVRASFLDGGAKKTLLAEIADVSAPDRWRSPLESSDVDTLGRVAGRHPGHAAHDRAGPR
jgi:aminodeoxyfutalosine deaminase